MTSVLPPQEEGEAEYRAARRPRHKQRERTAELPSMRTWEPPTFDAAARRRIEREAERIKRELGE